MDGLDYDGQLRLMANGMRSVKVEGDEDRCVGGWIIDVWVGGE